MLESYTSCIHPLSQKGMESPDSLSIGRIKQEEAGFLFVCVLKGQSQCLRSSVLVLTASFPFRCSSIRQEHLHQVYPYNLLFPAFTPPFRCTCLCYEQCCGLGVVAVRAHMLCKGVPAE